jgi:hypothetical protein
VTPAPHAMKPLAVALEAALAARPTRPPGD